ncbi:hypothetical protein [Streptomyces sp. NPDC055036]
MAEQKADALEPSIIRPGRRASSRTKILPGPLGRVRGQTQAAGAAKQADALAEEIVNTGTASRPESRAAARPHNSRATCDIWPAIRTVRR